MRHHRESRFARLLDLVINYPHSTTRALMERLDDGSTLPVVSAALASMRTQGRVKSVAGVGPGSPNTWTAVGKRGHDDVARLKRLASVTMNGSGPAILRVLARLEAIEAAMKRAGLSMPNEVDRG